MASLLPHVFPNSWKGLFLSWPSRLRLWWLDGLRDLLSAPVVDWLVSADVETLHLSVTQDMVSLQLLSGPGALLAFESTPTASYSNASIDRFLATRRLDRRDIKIGIALPACQFFERYLPLPAAAASVARDVALEDLARRTPFKIDDIHHDLVVSRSPGARHLSVHQYVIRRELVAEAIRTLGLSAGDVTFVEAMHDEATPDRREAAPSARIWLRKDNLETSVRVRRILWAAALGSMLLAATVASTTYRRQQAQLADLDVRISVARTQAQKVRSAVEKLEHRQSLVGQLRAQRAHVPKLLDLWEECTRILPEHTWLTELRVSDEGERPQIILTGLSAAAASLVGILDRSPLFTDAALTAPVTHDPVEGKERFALQAKQRAQR